MTVRCRRFQTDSVGKVHWQEYPGTAFGTVSGVGLQAAVCVYLSALKPCQIVAVCEGTSLYGMQFVSVYYREEDSSAPV